MAPQVIDLSALDQYRELMGEDAEAFTLEIVETFLEQSKRISSELTKNFRNEDRVSFNRQAHSIKSNLRLIGGWATAEKFFELEKKSDSDLNGIGEEMIRSALEELELIRAGLCDHYPSLKEGG
jgi:HPt (histidine-containing phosphotransfer) domain-containing protein